MQGKRAAQITERRYCERQRGNPALKNWIASAHGQARFGGLQARHSSRLVLEALEAA
jgi:hypothetical protein